MIKLAVLIAVVVMTVQYFMGESSSQPEDVTITKVQKWQDEQGVWHFSNDGTAPKDSETVQIRSDRNVIKTDYAKQLSALEGGQGESNTRGDEGTVGYSSVRTVQQGLDALQKAGGIQDMVDQRAQQQEKVLESYK